MVPAAKTARRAWLRKQLAEAKKDAKKTTATEKQHDDAISRINRFTRSLETLSADAPTTGKKKRGKKKGKK